MLIQGDKIMVLNLILLLLCITASVNAVESRKLDENGTGEKCTPCGYASPPPPPPLVYPPPPPSPKKPPSQYNCPPPPAPSSSIIYIRGPPGDLYPIDTNFSGANHHNHHRSFFLPLLVGLFTMLAFW